MSETLFTITILIFALLIGFLLVFLSGFLPGFLGFIIVFLVGVLIQNQMKIKERQHDEILDELKRIKR